jgi:hypothetical protein
LLLFSVQIWETPQWRKQSEINRCIECSIDHILYRSEVGKPVSGFGFVFGITCDGFAFCNRARILFISKNELFALKYTLEHSLIKII